MMSRRNRRTEGRPSPRRGATLVELMTSAAISLGVIGVLAAFGRLNSRMFQDALADTDVQKAAQSSVQLIAPTIRAARRVVVDQSNGGRVTLQVPAYDGAGNLVIPMVDGQVISYYLSDAQGSPTGNGNNRDILWRSVGGTPDTHWALVNGKGRIKLQPNGLTFTYFPTTDPQTVTVTIQGTRTGSGGTRSLTTSQEILLRNHGL